MTRLAVIGLDGATEEVLRQPDAGLINVPALREEGASCALRSTVPPITAAAWASMLTGWNPGRHGMYDFRRLAIERYRRLWGAGHSASFSENEEFVNSRRWAGSAVWDLVGDRGRVAVFSVPMTYPPWPVNGVLVSGFPLPDYGRNHSQPPEFGDRLPPLLEGAHDVARLSDAELAAHCLELIERQREGLLEVLADESYALTVAVFQSTDFAQHRLWKYLDTPDHPLREALLDMYRAIDRFVGEARDILGSQGTVAVVSDHGFGPHPKTFVKTDEALAQAGLLQVADGDPHSRVASAARLLRRAPRIRRSVRLLLNRLPASVSGWAAGEYSGTNTIDWSRTLAYRVPLYAPAEGVVVNLQGRQAEGAVAPGEDYEHVRDTAIEALLDLKDPETGTQVVQWARRREEVYEGRYLEEAPDVVALLDPRFKGAAGLGNVFDPVPESILASYPGVHAMDGIFAVAGPGVRRGADIGTRDIVDVAPTLLALLDVPIPAEIDGSPMEEALLEPVAVASAPTLSRAADGDEVGLTAEEERTLAQSLRALGYLE